VIGAEEEWGLGRPVNIQVIDFWSVSSYQSRELIREIRIAPYYRRDWDCESVVDDYREE